MSDITTTIRLSDGERVLELEEPLSCVPRVGDTISHQDEDGDVQIYRVVTVTFNFQHYPAALVQADLLGEADALPN
jgi:hypothetical protein